MNSVIQGIFAGLILGTIDILLMLPMRFSDKKTALLGAFLNRFAIGFVIANITLPIPFWAKGILIGLRISLPDAVITKSYVPILTTGIVGGFVVSFLVQN